MQSRFLKDKVRRQLSARAKVKLKHEGNKHTIEDVSNDLKTKFSHQKLLFRVLATLGRCQQATCLKNAQTKLVVKKLVSCYFLLVQSANSYSLLLSCVKCYTSVM